MTSIEACFESSRLAFLFLSSSSYSLFFGMISAICTWIPLHHIDLPAAWTWLGPIFHISYPYLRHDRGFVLYSSG